MINKKEIIKYYEDTLKEHGDTPQGVHWNDKEGQKLRFFILSQLKFSAGCSILDVGCGMAHFYDFLVERNKDGHYINYSGIDISKKMAHGSKKKHPHLTFGTHDIFVIDYTTYDFVVCSGMFNTLLSNNPSDWKEHCAETIIKMFELCKIGIAFNMLSSYESCKHEEFYYGKPEEWFSFAKKITKAVTLRHDYPLNDFTIFMYKMGEIE